MAIEKSIFDHDKMQMLLLQEYGFHLIENQHLPLGTANCYKISCEEGAYFFKEYQKEFTIQDVKREAELLDIGDFAQYVKEYMKYAPLSKRDLEAMPYVYLF